LCGPFALIEKERLRLDGLLTITVAKQSDEIVSDEIPSRCDLPSSLGDETRLNLKCFYCAPVRANYL